MTDVEHSTLGGGVDIHSPGYVQSGDPGAVGANILWVDNSAGAGEWVGKIRKAANDGWETLISGDVYVRTAGGQIDGDLIIDNTSVTAFVVRKDGAGGDVFKVDTTNARVGIGIDPYSGLHYQGDILYLTPAAGAESNDNITIKNYATGNGAPDIILRTADINGAYGIGVGVLSLIGGSKTTHYGGIGGGGGEISLQGGQGRDASNDPSGYAPVLLQSNGGNVGLGINSPNSAFHIKADISGTVGSHPAGQIIIQSPTDSVFANAVITGYESDGDGNPDQQLWYLGSSSSSNSDIIFLNRRNAKLVLGTNGVARMTILGNGTVKIGTSTAVSSILDEDAMDSDSAVALATQQSIKKYVDDNSGAGGVRILENQVFN